MPSGFSLEASLMMLASSSPNSRASSEIGLPGWYGAIARTYCGARSQISAEAGEERAAEAERCCLPLTSAHGRGIGPEVLHEGRLALERGQCPRDLRLALVTFDIHIEDVLPRSGASRPRLEPRHAHAIGRERRQESVHGTRHVARGHDERSLVVSRWRGIRLGDDE